MRTVALHKDSEGVYEGFDHAGRVIELIYDHSRMYCDACEGFHKV